MRIGGIFKANPLIGSYLVGAGFFVSHFHNPLPIAILVRASPARAMSGRAINDYLNGYPNVGVQTRAQFEQSQQAQSTRSSDSSTSCWPWRVVDRPDRDRQHPDAVGVRAHPRARPAPGGRDETPAGPGDDPVRGRDHRPVRSRHRRHHRDRTRESPSPSSLKQQGITEIAIPFASLVGFLVLSALLGLGAASWPARRAAKLDVLAAIATE